MALSYLFWLVPPLLQICILVLLVRRKAYRDYIFFFAFTAFGIAAEAVKITLYNPHQNTWAFFYAVWGSEAIYVVLGFLAIYEVFRRIFINFYALRLFKFLLPLVTVVMAVIAVLIPLSRPPVQTAPIISAILIAQIAVRCLQLGIFFLIFFLAKVFNLYYRQYAFGIAAGFGISASGILAGTLIRTHFGMSHLKFFNLVPSVSYCLAVCVWLVSFIRPEATDPFLDFQHLFTPELFLRQLQRYRQEIKEVLKTWALTFYCFLR